MRMEYENSEWFIQWKELAKREYHSNIPKYKWTVILENGEIVWKYIINN